MFKKTLVLVCLLLLSAQAFAAISVVEPVDMKVLPADSHIISFGKIARGETLEIVIKKKSDLAGEWVNLEVDEQLLPSGWSVERVDSDKTLIALVTVPTNAPISTQRMRFTAGSQAGQLFDETLYATVSVHESLLSASIENLNQDAILGGKASFNLVLNNDSIAEHSVRVESTLPGYWFFAQTVLLKPHETKTVELPVFPLSYGEKSFSFSVSSTQNSTQFSFPARMNVKPTLAGIYRTPIAGFPFFSPALLPYYLINGFLSLFS